MHLAAFFAVSIVILLIPGPAVMYIATRSATQGRAAGLVSVLGVASGGLIHAIAAAAGLSLVLVRSVSTMQYVRLAGAAYLIYLGIQKFREAASALQTDAIAVQRQSLGTIYRDGVVVNILNPKTALFFLSFLPQFVDPHGGPAAAQLLTLGGMFVVLALITDSSYALAAAWIASVLKSRTTFGRRFASWSSGAVYVGLGVAAALGSRQK